MPRNGAGIYSQPASDVNPPVAGTVIDPVAFAQLTTDIASELTNSLDRLGRGGMSGALNMSAFKITNLAPATLSTDGVRLGDVNAYLPAGSIIEFGGSVAPTGWLECDGSAVSRTVQAALFAAIGTTHGAGDGSTTFNLPDKRGYFTRGWDHGAGIDPARAFASTQVDSFKTHTHVQNAHTHTDSGHTHPQTAPDGVVGQSGGAVNAGSSASVTGTGTANISSTTAVNQSTGGTETVPKNKAGLFIIRT
jgi:microcystin-dependent protein